MNQTIRKRIEDINNGIVPEGYKQTPFGIFPCDWEATSIGEVSINKGEYGLNAPACEYEVGLPKYIRITDIDDNGNYVDTGACVNFQDETTQYTLKDRDIVFARTGATVGRNYLYKEKDGELLYAGFLIKFSIDKKVAHPYIVYANCNTKQYWDWIKKISARSGQPGVNAEEYSQYRFVKAKEKIEQEKIAEILMKWDEMVELQEQYIQKLELRKKAVIQQTLMSNKEWVEIPLTKIIKERKTYAVLDSEYPHVTLGKGGVVDKTEQYERDFLVKSEDKEYKITYPKDIVYNPANLKFGVICVNEYPTPAIFSPIYVTFEVNDKYNVDFVGAVLCSENFVRYIRKYEEGSLYERQAVKPEDFLKGKILVPERKVQDNIANIIHLANEEISLQKEKLAKIKEQRKAMQQYLLTGVVRV